MNRDVPNLLHILLVESSLQLEIQLVHILVRPLLANEARIARIVVQNRLDLVPVFLYNSPHLLLDILLALILPSLLQSLHTNVLHLLFR